MLEKGVIETQLVPGPVEYATVRAGAGPSSELPIVLWLHGGGGSSRFLETCQAQFVSCWAEGSLPDLVAVTPSAGWSYYLDRLDGSELWETFLLDELVPHIRKQTGSTAGPLVVGGISVGALASLRIAFRRPELVAAVAAVEPTIEAALRPDEILLRDRSHLPDPLRRRLFGDPIDAAYWQANHPLALVGANGPAIAAARTAIYLDCGDQDQFHVQYGAELLHRRLFDAGLSHEYRMVRGGNHVGPTVGPRVIDALRFVGRVLKPTGIDAASLEAVVEVETLATKVRQLETASGYISTRSAVPTAPSSSMARGKVRWWSRCRRWGGAPPTSPTCRIDWPDPATRCCALSPGGWAAAPGPGTG
jgi:S-formylglutathione hydrolase